MRTALMMALAALTLNAASRADNQPVKIDRAAFSRASDGIDTRLRQLWPDYPCELVGVTHAVYIRGYGAVLTGEVNLAPMVGVSPFHPTITKEDTQRARQKKTERMPEFRNALQDLLAKAAGQLNDIPDNEEIAIAFSLFYWHAEDRAGLPDQIVMHATKKALNGAKNKLALASVVHVEEY